MSKYSNMCFTIQGNVHGNCNYLKLNALFLTPEIRSIEFFPLPQSGLQVISFFLLSSFFNIVDRPLFVLLSC